MIIWKKKLYWQYIKIKSLWVYLSCTDNIKKFYTVIQSNTCVCKTFKIVDDWIKYFLLTWQYIIEYLCKILLLLVDKAYIIKLLAKDW